MRRHDRRRLKRGPRLGVSADVKEDSRHGAAEAPAPLLHAPHCNLCSGRALRLPPSPPKRSPTYRHAIYRCLDDKDVDNDHEPVQCFAAVTESYVESKRAMSSTGYLQVAENMRRNVGLAHDHCNVLVI